MLHIGAPKTGTTFLQAVLFRNQQRLREHGVLVPGLGRALHGNAATGVRQGPGGRKYPQWQRLLQEARAWPGTVVISNEWFSLASQERAEAALRDLAGSEVHVLFTARDFVVQLPSAWQETLKVGNASSLEEFVRARDTARDRWQWRVFDAAEALRRWSGDLPASQRHVITVPQGARPDLLWRRFVSLCGLDPDAYDIDVPQRRESLGVESARLLQEVGPALREALDADRGGNWQAAYQWIQRYLSHELLAARGGARIALDQSSFDELRQRALRSVATLREAGYDVVGDLDELTSATVPSGAREPAEVTAADLLDVALPLIPELLGRVAQEHARAEQALREAGSGNSTRHRRPARPA